jgi:hypothetical protein
MQRYGVKNQTTADVKVKFGGVVYTFPAGETVPIDDPNVARWFCTKVHRSGNKHERPVQPLALAEVSEDAPDGLRFLSDPEPMHPGRPFAPPGGRGTLRMDEPADPLNPPEPEPPEDIKAMRLRRALAGLPRETLIELCRKRGVYKKHLDVPQMADRLAAVGETAGLEL